MQLAQLFLWMVSAALALFGGWIIIANYATVVLWYTRGKHGSLGPLLGGVSFALAMLICPLSGVRRHAWVPLVIDLGCGLSFLSFLYAVFVDKCFKK